jgi:hypothetical protein
LEPRNPTGENCSRTSRHEISFLPYGQESLPAGNCGGVYDYDELLEQFQDPSNPDHEEALELLDADFDPEKFDLELVNKRLRSLR